MQNNNDPIPPFGQLQQIALQAMLQRDSAIEQLDWLRSVIHALRDRLADDPRYCHYETLAVFALSSADDFYRRIDRSREDLGESLG